MGCTCACVCVCVCVCVCIRSNLAALVAVLRPFRWPCYKRTSVYTARQSIRQRTVDCCSASFQVKAQQSLYAACPIQGNNISRGHHRRIDAALRGFSFCQLAYLHSCAVVCLVSYYSDPHTRPPIAEQIAVALDPSFDSFVSFVNVVRFQPCPS